MKKCIALFLSLSLLITLFIPVQVFAQNDQGLEQAIKTAKEKLEIPDTFTEFDYNISMKGDKKTWYLSWRNKDNQEGSMNVRIDNTGTILSYNYYKPYTDMDGKLPKISKDDAKIIAENFIKKVNPSAFNKIKYIENYQMSLMEQSYYFNYIRVENNIPFYENNITVSINHQTGEVQHYYYNWSDHLSFPIADEVISLEEAQEAFKEKLGLKLIYKYTYDYEKETINTYPAYVPKYNANEYIDAITGEKVNLGYGYYYGPGGQGSAMDVAIMKQRARVNGAANVVLSPEELKAIENVSNLLSQEEAENKIRELKILGLTKDFKVNNASLFRDWQSKEDFVWEFYFTNRTDDSKQRVDYKSVSVSLDAKTGEIKSFYIGEPYSPEEEAKEPKYDEKAAREAVEKFLKEFKPEKFNEVEYNELAKPILYPEDEKPRSYNFNYVRKVNGITFPDNGFSVSYNAVTGQITNFHMNWFNTDFVPVENAISVDEVSEKLFNEIGLELQYKANYAVESAKIIPEPIREIPEVKLVYAVKSGKPICFDAFTGTILDYNGEPYKGSEPVEYTDISGHFAEQYIYALAQYGIALEGPEFRPDETILQKEFLQLLTSTLSYYGPIVPLRSDKEVDEMYNILIREGIVKADEKNPEAELTREESVKFIIRALKYDKVADIQGIFNCTFSDKDMINPDLIGYVVIAQGLGIVNDNGEYFYPKNKLTRAESIVMIYNYLQI